MVKERLAGQFLVGWKGEIRLEVRKQTLRVLHMYAKACRTHPFTAWTRVTWCLGSFSFLIEFFYLYRLSTRFGPL